MSIFIKKLHIQNYKCFANEKFSFSVPDGTQGSGLNILIGENGNGKTAVLEAIDLLTSSNFSAENRLNISDFSDFKKAINIQAETDEFSCGSSIDFYKEYRFRATGITFNAMSRDRKSSGKLLSSPFQITSRFIVPENYIKKDGTQGKEVDSRDKNFAKSRMVDDQELNVFFFDKNRTRQIATGTFKTTFERICDDLNWHFVKNINDKNRNAILTSIVGDYFRHVQGVTNKNVGVKTASELQTFFDNDEFEHLRIELLNLLHPFSGAFFALRSDDELTQISVRDLGSGVEIILTLLMLKNIAGASKGSIIYLIDEPELHLHPKAQDKLLALLLEESKSKQIIVSTHSPYLLRGAISHNATLLLFARDSTRKIRIADARSKGWGLFPSWSPSWGEINYFAYDMATIEFHDELYGTLHERYIGAAPSQRVADVRGKQTDFEKNFLQKHLPAKRSWTPEFGGQPRNPEPVTLPTFIRNKSHHPENVTMQATNYSEAELKEAIAALIGMI